MNEGFWKKIDGFWKKIDPASWPAFFMFIVVLVAAGGLNYIGLAPVTGSFLAIAIAAFFGIGVLSWHIVESRTDDSQFQEEVAQSVKWGNAILDGALIFVNLFRADLRTVSVVGLTTWDAAAFGIIGLSAASHVVGFLLWTQNDPRRTIKKEGERGMQEIERKAQLSDNVIRKAEERLKKLQYVSQKEVSLRAQYGNIPGVDVEKIVRDMRTEAMKELQDIKPQDVETTRAIRRSPAFGSQTDSIPDISASVQNPPSNFTLADYLQRSGLTAGQARANFPDFESFAKDCSGRFDYISGGNLRRIYTELTGNPTRPSRN